MRVLSNPSQARQAWLPQLSYPIYGFPISASSSSSSWLPLSRHSSVHGKYASFTIGNLPSKTAFLHSANKPSWIFDVSTCADAVTSSGHGSWLLRSVFPTSPAVVSSVDDLFEFICRGPLMKKLGYTSEMVAENIDEWLEYQVSRHRSMFKDEDDIPPLVIGVSAPQGSGKTTLVFALNYLFRRTGRNSVTLSIDDFYLKAEDQAKLRTVYPGNALLEFRGNAGSHDLQFSIDTLVTLSELKKGTKMKVPRYDKSAYGGRGDRADTSMWPEVEGPLMVILFEGWMLGFQPLPNEVVKAVDPQLEVVNENLKAYYDAWDKFVKAWIIIKIKDPNCVYRWRSEAEMAMREDGKPGMSDEEVLDFVSRYLPAYKAYLPTLYSEGPKDSDPEHLLVVSIDEDRNPTSES